VTRPVRDYTAHRPRPTDYSVRTACTASAVQQDSAISTDFIAARRHRRFLS